VSVLRTIEQKIEALVEGVFGRAFRTNVQPVELARKLAKEMDDHRTVSVSRVYVPNEYTVYLSSPDHEQFAGYEESLKLELQDYLVEHARREGYVMLTEPVVLMTTDGDLDVGEFGIATRMVQGRRRPQGAPKPEPERGATMVYKPLPVEEDAAPDEVEVVRELFALRIDGQPVEVTKRRFVLGRSRDCDVQLADPNVSRRHAELRQEGPAYWIVDLDSTNGTEVNGERTTRAKLEDGDRITVGSTELVFERRLQAEAEAADGEES
jgi:FhaA, N-terminal domain/FHA domain